MPNDTLIVVHDGAAFEVAPFRSEPDDTPATDGWAAAARDARLRDFTVNALFCDPTTHTLLDYVGGRADLEAGVLRACGDPAARLRADALRCVRAARFAASLGLAIDDDTARAVREVAPECVPPGKRWLQWVRGSGLGDTPDN